MHQTKRRRYSLWARIDDHLRRYCVRMDIKDGFLWVCPGCRVALYAHVEVCRTCGIPRTITVKEH